MLRVLKYYVVAFTLLLAKASCTQPSDSPINQTMPNQRSFYMGFTAFPYDLTVKALEETYENVASNGDMYLNHLDHGVPWEEALNDLPFPHEIQQALEEAVDAVTLQHKFFLTATATNQSRIALADYWNNDGTHQPLPSQWQNRKFDDPEVISAYLKYCRRIIDFSHPDYFAYGIEINAAFQENSEAFTSYLIFADTIYHSLKQTYPALPIMLTFQDQSFDQSHDKLLDLTRTLLEYSDYIAMSTYPYWQYQHPKRDANPNLFSNNWLEDFRNLDPSKPFAISETGFCAEDLIIDAYGVRIKGSPEWQMNYLQKLFNSAHKLKAEFISWFVYRDYDPLYDQYYSPDPITRIWKDSGLLDGLGNKRPAFDEWQKWKNLPKR